MPHLCNTLSNHVLSRHLHELETEWQQNCPPLLMRVSHYVNNGMFVNLFTVMSKYKRNVKLTVTGQHVNINVQRVSLRL